jgi:nucleotide-binding universal stress UspA family protein
MGFSSNALPALLYARSLAREFGARLISVHVTEAQIAVPQIQARFEQFYVERLREVISEENGVQCEYQVEFGEPAQGIPKAVSRGRADLIVMGVHGGGALVRASTHFGTTAHRVVSLSPLPVLTVRGSDSSSPY